MTPDCPPLRYTGVGKGPQVSVSCDSKAAAQVPCWSALACPASVGRRATDTRACRARRATVSSSLLQAIAAGIRLGESLQP